MFNADLYLVGSQCYNAYFRQGCAITGAGFMNRRSNYVIAARASIELGQLAAGIIVTR